MSDDELDSSEDDEKEASSSSSNNKEEIETKAAILAEPSNQDQMESNDVETPVAPADIPSTSPNEPLVNTDPPKEQAPIIKESVPSTPASEQSSSASPSKPESVPVPTPAAPEPTSFEPVNLDDFDSAKDLESLGLNHLKHELTRRGMKCGGALPERASRLFSIKGLSPDEIDPSLLAKPPKKK